MSFIRQVLSSPTIFKMKYFRMAANLKVPSLPIEYCAFMVAIMITRCKFHDEMQSVQQSPDQIAKTMNSFKYGEIANFYVSSVALHQGIFLFKKALQDLGYELIVMTGQDSVLMSFFTLPGVQRGYEVKYPPFDKTLAPLDYTEDTLSNSILLSRNYLFSRGSYVKSNYQSCSSVFLELFVDVATLVEKKSFDVLPFMTPESAKSTS